MYKPISVNVGGGGGVNSYPMPFVIVKLNNYFYCFTTDDDVLRSELEIPPDLCTNQPLAHSQTDFTYTCAYVQHRQRDENPDERKKRRENEMGG